MAQTEVTVEMAEREIESLKDEIADYVHENYIQAKLIDDVGKLLDELLPYLEIGDDTAIREVLDEYVEDLHKRIFGED